MAQREDGLGVFEGNERFWESRDDGRSEVPFVLEEGLELHRVAVVLVESSDCDLEINDQKMCLMQLLRPRRLIASSGYAFRIEAACCDVAV
jgi:hypothetical protein